MRDLFEISEINGMKLNNRFVRSATWTGLGHSNGTCSQRLVDLLVELARGGVGLIITGHAYVQKNGKAGPQQLAIDRDSVIPGLKLLTDAIHEHDGKIIIQLSHSGIYGDPKLSGHVPSSVSNKGTFVSYPVKVLTPGEIERVVASFVIAAERSMKAGFDGIQLHAAHGYLLNQFLSRAYNNRIDGYGGDVVFRAFPLVEIVRRTRKVVGPLYPILLKLNSRDYLENGLELDESLEIAKILENAGVDAIEISGGTRESGHLKSARTGIIDEKDEAYFEEDARAFRKHLGIPVILVGGIRSYETAQRLLSSGATDYISMSRPFICQPNLINKWRSGEVKRSTCLSDNECLGLGLHDNGIRCRWSSRVTF
ncbi:MAG: NADH:flavin oxidoreductase [Desulfuromonadaceae bacterium]|nr:NADH:flavin oxidoreductase [Desulfuromonadaceae bacterium]